MSAYGQADFNSLKKLGTTVGLRYTYDDKVNPHFFAGASIKPVSPATYYDRASCSRTQCIHHACSRRGSPRHSRETAG